MLAGVRASDFTLAAGRHNDPALVRALQHDLRLLGYYAASIDDAMVKHPLLRPLGPDSKSEYVPSKHFAVVPTGAEAAA
jgi:hypothetical protein